LPRENTTSDPYPPDSSEYAELYPRATLREVYFTLLKHRWAAVAVGLATWLAGGLSSYLETPVYRSTALIQIDWEKINLVEDVMVNPTRGLTDLYGTQEKIVKSRLLAERVVDDRKLWEHPLFAGQTSQAGVDPKARAQAAARSIQTMVQVRRLEKTQLMEVSYLTRDPQLSADLANSLVDQYIQFNVDSESGLARGTSHFIDGEVQELRRDIMEKEKLLRDAARNRAIVIGDGAQGNIITQRLETLNLQLTEAEADRAAAEAKYRSLSKADPRSLQDVRNSTAVRELERKRLALIEKHEELSSTFGPDWPEMKRVKSAIAEVERSLDDTVREEARKIVAETRVFYQEALDRETLIRRSLEAQKSTVQDLHLASADFEQVKVELENQRQMLQGLLKRRSETDLNADLGERQPVKVKIIERAEPPAAAFAPGARRFMLMVGLLGIVLGIATAYVMDHWDDSIHTVEDLKRYVPLPYLGMIPRYGDKPALAQLGRRLSRDPRAEPESIDEGMAAKRSSYLPTLYDRDPLLAENRNTLSERFRFLRGSMLLSTPGSVPKVVLVTSPDKSCGKTFVSSNLSCALVQLGKKVLLIDGDLRNPKLHRVFHYRNRVGLTNVLTGQKQLGDGCIMRTDIPNLFLLMAGPASPNPGELLASQAMETILANCAEHFDFVILDSAPLLPVFDSHILSTRCDAVVLVARAGTTSRHATIQAIEAVSRVNGKITGIVLNDVNLEDYAQYYYHSHYTYEYGRYPSEGERVRMG
jgi:capsular exopolysaccharide synthesis family protein